MANTPAIRRKTTRAEPRAAKTASIDRSTLSAAQTGNQAANDNASMLQQTACLAVTDEEVTLLHRYLSREILGLFS